MFPISIPSNLNDFSGLVQLKETKNPDCLYHDIDNPSGLIYSEFIAWNTHMIQKLYKENEQLKNRIIKLEEAIANM